MSEGDSITFGTIQNFKIAQFFGRTNRNFSKNILMYFEKEGELLSR